MKFNSYDVKEVSMAVGDQEGRLIYKSPPKVLYDAGYKERWFKLKGNFLFYYQLNEDGVVENNEPLGLFVLENILVEKETTDAKFKNGFTISWKDDPYRKHGFFPAGDNNLQAWINKIVRASYENLRAELLVLRLQIRQKSGKDPLENVVPFSSSVCSIRNILTPPSQSLAMIRSVSSSQLQDLSSHQGDSFKRSNRPNCSAPSSPSTLKKSYLPVPPPRRNRDKKNKKNYSDCSSNVCQKESSFQCHLHDDSQTTSQRNDNSSFKSHIDGAISQENLKVFLK